MVSALTSRIRARTACWLAAFAWLAGAAPVFAGGPYTWNTAASGQSWNVAGNWSPTGGPPTAGDQATLNGVITGASTIVLNTGDTVGLLNFTDVNTSSATAAYTLGSAATPTFTFNNGAAANQIVVSGFTRSTQTFTAGIALGSAQPLSITNNGAPGLTALALNGNLTGSGGAGLNVDGDANTTIGGAIGNTFGTLTKTGSGTLLLTNTNAYTGGTVINGGTVSVSADGQLGAAAGAITLNGGALRITDTSFTTARNVSIGASGGLIDTRVGGGSTNPTFNGVISGSSTLTVDGGGFAILNGVNTFSGALVIRNAGVNLSSHLSNVGTLANVSSITIQGGYPNANIGILTLDNSFVASNTRINPTAPITLNGGALSMTGNLTGSVSQTFGNVQVNGYGLINGSPAGSFGGTTTMSFGTLTRHDNFTTLYVGGTIGGPASNSSVQITFSGMPLSSGSGTEIDVIPWIGGDHGQPSSGSAPGAPTNVAETLFVYDNNGLRALDTTSGNDFIQLAAGDPLDNGAGSNVSLSGSPAAMTNDVSIKALVLNTSATGSSTITGTGFVLNVSNGAIANVRALTFNGPQLDFGAATGYLYLGSNLTVTGNSFITGTGGLVVSSNSATGNNTLNLNNTANANTFSGGLYLNGTARAAFTTSDSQLGLPGEVIALRGGTLRYSGSASISLATSGTNRPLVMDTGSGYIDVSNVSGTLTVPGLVSGTDSLTKLGAGKLVLANTTNTYQGGTVVSAGTLAVAGAGSLGTGGVELQTNTTLQFNGNSNLAAPVLMSGPATVNTNGNNVTFSGIVSGNGTTFTKSGAGALTLTGTNTFTNNTTISGGRLAVNNTTGSGTGYGSVTVASGGTLSGTGTSYGAVSVASGGTLAPGDATGKLTVRSSVALATGATYAATINGKAANSFSQLAMASGASLNLGSATFSPTLGYVPNPSDVIFLVDNQNAIGGLSGTFNGLADGATVTFADGTRAQISYFGNLDDGTLTGGNDVVLYNFQPVPEPGLLLAICCGTLVAGGVSRRRRRWASSAA